MWHQQTFNVDFKQHHQILNNEIQIISLILQSTKIEKNWLQLVPLNKATNRHFIIRCFIEVVRHRISHLNISIKCVGIRLPPNTRGIVFFHVVIGSKSCFKVTGNYSCEPVGNRSYQNAPYFQYHYKTRYFIRGKCFVMSCHVMSCQSFCFM